MSSNAETDARIRFLDASARLLHNAVPETSAHLMQQRNEVAEECEKILNQKQVKDICKACGTILNLGSTSRIIPLDVSLGKKKKRIAREPEATKEQLKIECLSCRRMVPTEIKRQQEMDMQNALSHDKLKDTPQVTVSKVGSVSNDHSADSPKPASANASSKKRTKARKQGGLQALLEKSKGKTLGSTGLGLDLMDFMKET
ncbi:MAG: hypothetical protein Q9219_004981 [cf. Caloplaca sp. 3 TL-2023]